MKKLLLTTVFLTSLSFANASFAEGTGDYSASRSERRGIEKQAEEAKKSYNTEEIEKSYNDNLKLFRERCKNNCAALDRFMSFEDLAGGFKAALDRGEITPSEYSELMADIEDLNRMLIILNRMLILNLKFANASFAEGTGDYSASRSGRRGIEKQAEEAKKSYSTEEAKKSYNHNLKLFRERCKNNCAALDRLMSFEDLAGGFKAALDRGKITPSEYSELMADIEDLNRMLILGLK